MLSVKYTGPGNHCNDVGAIQSDFPVPTRRLIYYFEVYIANAGKYGVTRKVA